MEFVPEGRPQDCTVGGGRKNPDLSYLEWLADPAHSRLSHISGRILDPERFEAVALALGIRLVTAHTEFAQLEATGSIDVTSLGDGQYRFSITDLGRTRLDDIRKAREEKGTA